MNIARILYPVKVLGPGNRIGIWTAGCPRRCHGCSNPELWESRPQYEVAVPKLMTMLMPLLNRRETDGVIITGGDPFFNPRELYSLLLSLGQHTDDILVYTGYTIEELRQGDRYMQLCLDHIGVLIDGPYDERRNDGCRMRGSSNQHIHYLDPGLRERYEAYMADGPNRIQNFTVADGIVSVGIHSPGFSQELASEARKRGVILSE
jgi:anaerobic ribonucleoside-triphosphate reductase activating protein